MKLIDGANEQLRKRRVHANVATAALQAMFVSFGMAEHLGGECVLRFDDTNPEAEKQEYIDHIQDIVAWMGWKPSKAGPPSPPSIGCHLCTLLMHMPAQAMLSL